MPSKNPPVDCPINNCLTRGRAQFATSWRRWVRQWTQTGWLKLSDALHGAKVLHSSQYSAFSEGLLLEPGPKVFAAAGYLNVSLARSIGYPQFEELPDIGLPEKLPAALSELWAGRRPLVDAEGIALGPSGLFMAFCGLRALQGALTRHIPPQEAEAACRALGRALRAHLLRQGRDFVTELDEGTLDPIAEEVLLGNAIDAARLEKALPQLATAMALEEDELWVMMRLPN